MIHYSLKILHIFTITIHISFVIQQFFHIWSSKPRTIIKSNLFNSFSFIYDFWKWGSIYRSWFPCIILYLILSYRRSVISVIGYSTVCLLFDIIKFIISIFINSSLFVLSILTHLDFHSFVVSVNCISFIYYSFHSQASTPEQILQHLHSYHEQDPIPRFCRGKYCKSSHQTTNNSLTLPSQQLVTGNLPSSLLHSSYHFIHDFHLPGLQNNPLSIHTPSSDLKLTSYDTEMIESNCVLLNCGGGIVSSSMFNGYLAVSCVDNRYGLILPHRSIQSNTQSTLPISNYDNIITIYSISSKLSIKPFLHLFHHHSYATQLCWIPIPTECEEVIGVLGCVYVDGSVDIVSVGLLNETNYRFLIFNPPLLQWLKSPLQFILKKKNESQQWTSIDGSVIFFYLDMKMGVWVWNASKLVMNWVL